MGLKILHSADWHLDSPFGGFPEEQRQYLKEEQRKLPGKIADLCRREDCDLMLLAGDIFDGTPKAETIAILKKALADTGIPVLISPGNHDYCGNGNLWQEESWPENVYVFTGPLESVTISALDCRIYGAAFHSMDCESLLEGFEAQGEERYCVAVLHGDPMQKNSPYNAITAAQVRQSGLDYLALGHIHKAGAFRSGNTLCAWPGCPMGRGWDETEEKGVCIVTLEDTAQIRPVSLDTVRFYDLTVNVETDVLQELEQHLPAAGSEDFYRVTLTGCGNVNLEELKAQFPELPHLEFRDQTEPPLDIWGSADEDSLEGVYFGLLRRAMDLEPENARQIELAAEISRKLLLGKEVIL